MTFKPIALCAALVAPMAVQAEESEGLSLMEEGARLFLEGLQQQMEPAIEDLQDFARDVGPEMQSFLLEMGPAFREMMAEVEDWSVFHAPEVLPNGDIILRRKVPEDVADVPESGETDL